MNQPDDFLKLSIVIKPDISHPVMEDHKMNEESLKSQLISSPDGISKFKQTLKNGEYKWVIGCYSLHQAK